MKIKSCVAAVSMAGAMATTIGVGSAAAADQIPLPPTLTDNAKVIPNAQDPLGAPTYQLDSSTYTVTVTNPNSGDVVCGVAVIGADLATMSPVQMFPNAADWDVNQSGWSTFPGAVPAGQSRTYTVDTSGVSFNEFMVYSGCGNETFNGPMDIRHVYRMAGIPGLGSLGSLGSLGGGS